MEDDGMSGSTAASAAAQDTPEAAFIRSLTEDETTTYLRGTANPLVRFFTTKGLNPIRSADIPQFMVRVRALYNQQQGTTGGAAPAAVAGMGGMGMGGSGGAGGMGMGGIGRFGGGSGSVPAVAGMGGMGMGGMGSMASSGGAAPAVAGMGMGGSGSAGGMGMGGSGGAGGMGMPDMGIRVTAGPVVVEPDDLAETAIVLYDPNSVPRAPVQPINAAEINNAAYAAERRATANHPTNGVPIRIILTALATPIEVAWGIGRYTVSKLFKFIYESSNEGGTLLQKMREYPELPLSDIKYKHALLELLRTEANKSPSEQRIDSATLNLAIDAFEAGDIALTATYEMLNSFITLMNAYPTLTPADISSSGPGKKPAGLDVKPAEIIGLECDLVKRYMIFVYYMRRKAAIRGHFAEEWSSLSSQIKAAFENPPPGGFISWLGTKLASIYRKAPTGSALVRAASIVTVRDATLDNLLSVNEIFLINGVINNTILAKTEDCTTVPGLKAAFDTFLNRVEMDIATIKPGQKERFADYIKTTLLSAARKSSVTNVRGLGKGARNYTGVFAPRAPPGNVGVMGGNVRFPLSYKVASVAGTIVTAPITIIGNIFKKLGNGMTIAFTAYENLANQIYTGFYNGIEPALILHDSIGNTLARFIPNTPGFKRGPMQVLIDAAGNVINYVTGSVITVLRRDADGRLNLNNTYGILSVNADDIASSGQIDMPSAAGGGRRVTDGTLSSWLGIPPPSVASTSGGAAAQRTGGGGGAAWPGAGSTESGAGGGRSGGLAGPWAGILTGRVSTTGTPTQDMVDEEGNDPMGGNAALPQGQGTLTSWLGRGGYRRRTRRAAKHSRKHRIIRKKKQTRVNRKRVTRRR